MGGQKLITQVFTMLPKLDVSRTFAVEIHFSSKKGWSTTNGRGEQQRFGMCRNNSEILNLKKI